MLPLENYFWNTSQVESGKKGESKARKWLDEHGISYVDRTGKHEREDFVANIEGKRLRLQIKHSENGQCIIQGGRVNSWYRYTKEMIDAMVLIYGKEHFAIPVEETCKIKTKGLTFKQANKKFAKYKNNMSFYDCTEYNPTTAITELFGDTNAGKKT